MTFPQDSDDTVLLNEALAPDSKFDDALALAPDSNDALAPASNEFLAPDSLSLALVAALFTGATSKSEEYRSLDSFFGSCV
mmetsp:Transcript_23938/g.20125  ORF Transcript_23938/g.20125 Transcript_23938/m.20125 type:complete len:81 (+) Transcript_23938:395-637(+)